MPSSSGRFHVQSAAEVQRAAPEAVRGEGLKVAELVGGHVGAVHTGMSICTLGAGGSVDEHLHSNEQSFYVLAGNPQLSVDGRIHQLAADDCGLVPVGVPHAWRAGDDGEAVWAEVRCPAPRLTGPPDTFWTGSRPPSASRPNLTSAIRGRARSSASVAAR